MSSLFKPVDVFNVLSRHVTLGNSIPYDLFVSLMPLHRLPIDEDNALGVLDLEESAKTALKKAIFGADPPPGPVVYPPEVPFGPELKKLINVDYPTPKERGRREGWDADAKALTTPTGNFRSWFLSNLQRWEGAPAEPAMWYIVLDLPELAKSGFRGTVSPAIFERGGTSNDFTVGETITGTNFMNGRGSMGCFFASSIVSPSESLEVRKTTPVAGSGNLSPFNIIAGREWNFLQELSMRFRETNVSFCDMVLRPWLMVLSHTGLAVTDPNMGSRYGTLYMVELAKQGSLSELAPINGKDIFVKKVFVYHNVFPIKVEGLEKTHNATNTMVENNVTFAFSHYTTKGMTPSSEFGLGWV